MSLFDVATLEQWQRYQPVSVLALDIADRAVLRVAGRTRVDFDLFNSIYSLSDQLLSLSQQQNTIKF